MKPIGIACAPGFARDANGWQELRDTAGILAARPSGGSTVRKLWRPAGAASNVLRSQGDYFGIGRYNDISRRPVSSPCPAGQARLVGPPPLSSRAEPIGWLGAGYRFCRSSRTKQSRYQRHYSSHHVVAGQPRIIHERKCQLGHIPPECAMLLREPLEQANVPDGERQCGQHGARASFGRAFSHFGQSHSCNRFGFHDSGLFAPPGTARRPSEVPDCVLDPPTGKRATSGR